MKYVVVFNDGEQSKHLEITDAGIAADTFNHFKELKSCKYCAIFHFYDANLCKMICMHWA